MRILFTGGGTMGSVIPLIAVAEKIKVISPNIDLIWLGTRHGPERAIVRDYNIEFRAIFTGKWRRYFSLLNIADFFKFILGAGQTFYYLVKKRPVMIVGAGSYAQVAPMLLGYLFKIPCLIHQQDARPGLANKLCSPVAQKITLCLPESKKFFAAEKSEVIGNPIREALKHKITETLKQELFQKFNLREGLPVVLILGGGTGSSFINNLVWEAARGLAKFCQIIHIIGKNRIKNYELRIKNLANYHSFDFLMDSTEMLRIADMVVSRAGMGTFSEIAYLGKPAVVIPIPKSHQEENADYFGRTGGAIVLEQDKIEQEDFIKIVKKILEDKKEIKKMGELMHGAMAWGAEEKMARMIIEIIKT